MSQYTFEPTIGEALGASLNPLRRNPDSENPMLDTHFKMTFTRIPNVTFWCSETNIPSISIGDVTVRNQFAPIRVPGSSIQFEQLRVSFPIDENFANWNEIYTWMQQIVPFEDFRNILKKDSDYYSDATVHCLNSAKQPNIRFIFKKLFPISMEGFNLNTMLTDTSPIIITASFAFETFSMERV